MKFFLLLVSTCLSTFMSYAQIDDIHHCAKMKLAAFSQIQKQTRASTNDVALMNKYDVHHYHLDIAAENNSLSIGGSTTISASVIANSMDTFAFELHHDLVIDSVQYLGALINFSRLLDMSYAIFPSTVGIGANVSVKIYYHGVCPQTGSSAIGYGFNTDTSPSWGNSVTWSLSQPFSAYHWFPVKQSLQDKADSSSVYITTSNLNKVGSNGILLGVDTLPNNKLKFKWHSKLLIDYYLISVSIANYVDYTIFAHPANLLNDSIRIQNFVYNNPNTLPYFKNSIDTIAQMLSYFSENILLYPFYQEKYGHCMAPFTGGMEHQTMTTQGLFEFGLNAHELFHQWFGNHVTCKTWSDIFVNEGFASYGEYLALNQFRGYTAAQSSMKKVHASVKTQPSGSVFFTDTNVARIFDSRLTYDKGAAVIHSLRYVLGDSLFFKTLSTFQTQFSFSNASIQDFKLVAENVSGINLTQFFNQWIYGEGYPVIKAEYANSNDAIVLNIKHQGSMPSNSLYKMPLEITCVSPSGDTTVVVNLVSNSDTFYFPSNKQITNLKIDPNNWIIDSVKSITPNLALDLSFIESQSSDLVLYPNPAREFVFIQSKKQFHSYQIFDLNGKQITGEVTINDAKISTTNLSNGNYYFKFFNLERKCILKKVSIVK
jgi:aminopeptidase N